MALINCQNCGNKISDKAVACPKCGAANLAVPSQTAASFAPLNAESGADNGKPKKNIIKKVVPIAVVVLFFAAAVTAAVLFIPKNIKVNSIEIESWTFQDDDEYYSNGYYIGTVTADTKEPFIAVITNKNSGSSDEDEIPNTDTSTDTSSDNDTNSDKSPDYVEISYSPYTFVYMQDGTGEFKLADDEPNDYTVESYFVGETLSEKDFNEIKFEYTEYDDLDYLEETACSFNVSFEMKKPKSGILFCSRHNNLTNTESPVDCIVIINGEGIAYGNSLLPYKSRDTKAIEIKNMYFVPMSAFPENTVKYDKNYFSNGGYSTLWEGEVTTGEPIDGFLIFSKTLEKGGHKSDMGKEVYEITSMGDGVAHIYVFDYFMGEDFENPEYSYKFYGYVEVKRMNDK